VPAGPASHGPPPEVRLQKLVDANCAIVAELSLTALLRRVVEAARDIVGAEFAALGVFGADGTLEQFIHCGMDATTVAALGELPKGRGLLGALLEDPRPIRLRTLADDPRSCGVPIDHPPIGSFLGVPIRSASSVYGNLYLTNRIGQDEFSAEDEQLLDALAATSGIAIENARLYEQSHRRAQWLHASAEITHQLLAPGADSRSLLGDVADSIRQLAAADTVCLCLPVPEDPGTLEMVVTSGRGGVELRGLRYPAAGSIAAETMQEGRGLVVGTLEERLKTFAHLSSVLPVTDVMALPLKGAGAARGAILVCRVDQRPFTEADVEMATSFTSQATLALEMSDARAGQHQLAMLEDRARIARELHDHVVQKLFGAGLTIQGTATMVADPQVRGRLASTIATLDDTIRSIRTSIFELQDPDPAPAPVRPRVSAVLAELVPVLGFTPHLQFEGPVDAVADEALATELEAVLRESLTNVAKHSRASHASVVLSSNGELLCLTIADDGVGLGASRRRSGLSNLRERAERLGGYLELERSAGGGLLVRWTIPLP
jgi:two-component system, NarL family, sensor histidine kinase DevS